MNGQTERDIVNKLYVYGWALFGLFTVTSFYAFQARVIWGVVIGGLLVTINLLFLKKVVYKATEPGSKVTPKSILPKYYLSFGATCGIIFLLISLHLVNELGLLLGLAIFILDLFIVVAGLAGRILYRTIILKEAV